MFGYKGFDEDFKCKDFQYQVDETYKMSDWLIEPCVQGFHFCEYPLNILEFYGPTAAKFAKINALGLIKTNDDKKFVTNEIRIDEEIEIDDLFKDSINYINKHIDSDIKSIESTTTNRISVAPEDHSKVSNDINHSALIAIGDYSISSVSGAKSCAIATGDRSLAIGKEFKTITANTGSCGITYNTGDKSISASTGGYNIAYNLGVMSVATVTDENCVAINKGYFGIAATTNDFSIAHTKGIYSIAACTGDSSEAISDSTNSPTAINTGCASIAKSSGYKAVAITTGTNGMSSVDGNLSVAISLGYNAIAKGALGSWLVLAEYSGTNDEKIPILLDIKAFKVDGKNILPDEYYRLKDGKPECIPGIKTMDNYRTFVLDEEKIGNLK